LQEEFYNYLINIGRTHNTAYSYSNAINHISQNYAQNIGQEIDIYQIQEQNIISEIAQKYSLNGQYSDAGNTGNGTWRNAIARYSEFFADGDNVAILENNIIDEANIENIVQEEQTNFAYERDLQKTLCAQITELFPSYKIYGENNQGIEYSINNRRIDVLLEHIENNDLLVVELKSGNADYRVFGQISMYIGLVQEKFPDKKVSGVIISSSIHESLQQACAITDRIELKVYRMKLELEEA
jgi:hypothetical protein